VTTKAQRAILLVLLLRGIAAAGTLVAPADPLCAAVQGRCVRPPYVAVMSAFPAEIEPLVAATRVAYTVVEDGRTYYVGRLAHTPVVLVRGGIGLVNATDTAQTLLDRFELAAIVFSGVAGSSFPIGDVVVPEEWSDGTDVIPVDPDLLAIARTLSSPPVPLDRCTNVPPDPPGAVVCLDHGPAIDVGGLGESSDPYGGNALTCSPGTGPVFGCDEAVVPRAAAVATSPVAQDMETAAVAKVARAAKIPFIGFRGVSDGPGDPLGLPGFPAQFFAYYRLSANNAAAATRAFLAARAKAPHHGRSAVAAPVLSAPRTRIRAACDWERAASPACGKARAPRNVTGRVNRACALMAEAATAAGSSAVGATRNARQQWERAATLLDADTSSGLSRQCRRALTRVVRSRSKGRAAP